LATDGVADFVLTDDGLADVGRVRGVVGACPGGAISGNCRGMGLDAGIDSTGFAGFGIAAGGVGSTFGCCTGWGEAGSVRAGTRGNSMVMVAVDSGFVIGLALRVSSIFGATAGAGSFPGIGFPATGDGMSVSGPPPGKTDPGGGDGACVTSQPSSRICHPPPSAR
jgi:hypothetical protein